VRGRDLGCHSLRRYFGTHSMANLMTDFDAWFSTLTGRTLPPHEWQRSLAARTDPDSRVIRVPTGMGKTLGVLATWAWHRVHRRDDAWPRRLVWCLPMRVLVEQTEAVVREALASADLVWDGSSDHAGRVGVHPLMGGVSAGGDWHLFPEETAVLIGTQDMLLSRAMNRGFAAGRARWPLEFGQLNHDALWVMDEVQLMDVGLATSAQLQAYADQDAAKGFRPRHTWWMSATLQPAWLRTVDTQLRHDTWTQAPTGVSAAHLATGVGAIQKTVSIESVPAADTEAFAALALRCHQTLQDDRFGRVTLVVCNTVSRACTTYDHLRALEPTQEVELVHSRFRPFERANWRERFLDRQACRPGANRIIVATQVVEAGVDISAGCVVTELAPWSSLVQRFGRCARYGGSGVCTVVDRGRDDKDALPYETHELAAAEGVIQRLLEAGGAVGVAALELFEHGLTEGERLELYPYQPRHLLLRREYEELFDTTPDLTGADVDISRFIRTGDERDLLVCWTAVPPNEKGKAPQRPPSGYRARREELCPVPFLQARDWLCGRETKTSRKPRLRGAVRAWVWDWLDGEWVVAERALLTPGRIVCVEAASGGYRVERGFDASATGVVPPVPLSISAVPDPAQEADESEGNDALSASAWKTIGRHSDEVVAGAQGVGAALGLMPHVRHALELAARWHDIGKAHPAFQGAIGGEGRPPRQDLAKAPDGAWLKPPGSYQTFEGDKRPGLRHELVSALALFAVLERGQPDHAALLGPWAEAFRLLGRAVPSPGAGVPITPDERAVLACDADAFDLLVYLVAAHHGKVRMALHPTPKDQDYRETGDGRGLPIRGVREGDTLPPVALGVGREPVASLTLTLDPASLGLSQRAGRSWRERSSELVERFGPGGLAWLESVLIAADRRASRLTTPDPALMPGGRSA